VSQIIASRYTTLGASPFLGQIRCAAELSCYAAACLVQRDLQRPPRLQLNSTTTSRRLSPRIHNQSNFPFSLSPSAKGPRTSPTIITSNNTPPPQPPPHTTRSSPQHTHPPVSPRHNHTALGLAVATTHPRPLCSDQSPPPPPKPYPSPSCCLSPAYLATRSPQAPAEEGGGTALHGQRSCFLHQRRGSGPAGLGMSPMPLPPCHLFRFLQTKLRWGRGRLREGCRVKRLELTGIRRGRRARRGRLVWRLRERRLLRW